MAAKRVETMKDIELVEELVRRSAYHEANRRCVRVMQAIAEHSGRLLRDVTAEAVRRGFTDLRTGGLLP